MKGRKEEAGVIKETNTKVYIGAEFCCLRGQKGHVVLLTGSGSRRDSCSGGRCSRNPSHE